MGPSEPQTGELTRHADTTVTGALDDVTVGREDGEPLSRNAGGFARRRRVNPLAARVRSCSEVASSGNPGRHLGHIDQRMGSRQGVFGTLGDGLIHLWARANSLDSVL
jgi:hypothetical protein